MQICLIFKSSFSHFEILPFYDVIQPALQILSRPLGPSLVTVAFSLRGTSGISDFFLILLLDFFSSIR